ncbi:MAG: diaminopimelate decarboxylase [Synergistaceae bacterium]|nr:diaminopimelate decarboxylase [Synergistaceae bacterium]
MSRLLWGGADCVELAREFGTPLYVMDESLIRTRCVEIRETFLNKWPNTAACYASKAFLTKAMARIVEQEGLGLDVVSEGELRVALAANFPSSRVEMHGNAKSEKELRGALIAGVGRIVVDGIMELELLSELAAETGQCPGILLRVAPGVTPHTHSHIVTGQEGSKFGFPIDGELLRDALCFAVASPSLSFKGFHFHVGSQIFENTSHLEAVERVVTLAEKLKIDKGIEVEELNFGGGFGIGTLPDLGDGGSGLGGTSHVPLRLFTDAMMETLVRECQVRCLKRPFITIEPGRWVVGESGITLYSVETVKRLPSVIYVAVDGGMADNPRPSLYQAKYRGALANKFGDPAVGEVAVVGKCCETGDVLIESIALPSVERGDVLAVFNTGAYNFSMASNYNRLPRPAVVLVKDGDAEVIIERQTHDDLLRGDYMPRRVG